MQMLNIILNGKKVITTQIKSAMLFIKADNY